MKKNKTYTYLSKRLNHHCSSPDIQQIIVDGEHILDQLQKENKDEPKAVKVHTFEKIYPVIACYQAMLKHGISKEKSVAFLDRALSDQAIPQAKMIQIGMKIPFLYKTMPAMFHWMTVHNFGEDAGFHANFYDTDSTMCKFDMTECLYYKTCKRYHCEDIAPCFCHVDDVTNGNMHPYLHWHRIGTIAEGYPVCDFQIKVDKQKRNKA